MVARRPDARIHIPPRTGSERHLVPQHDERRRRSASRRRRRRRADDAVDVMRFAAGARHAEEPDAVRILSAAGCECERPAVGRPSRRMRIVRGIREAEGLAVRQPIVQPRHPDFAMPAVFFFDDGRHRERDEIASRRQRDVADDDFSVIVCRREAALLRERNGWNDEDHERRANDERWMFTHPDLLSSCCRGAEYTHVAAPIAEGKLSGNATVRLAVLRRAGLYIGRVLWDPPYVSNRPSNDRSTPGRTRSYTASRWPPGSRKTRHGPGGISIGGPSAVNPSRSRRRRTSSS